MKIRINYRGGEWSKWWVELWGTTLRLWRVPDVLSELGYRTSLNPKKLIENEFDPGLLVIDGIKSVHNGCVFINVAQAVTHRQSHSFIPQYDAPPPPPYSSFFSCSTAGSNLYNFATLSSIQANSWVAAIRLSQFEQLKINWLNTSKFLRNVNAIWDEFGIKPLETGGYRGDIKIESVLSVKPQYFTRETEMYAVCTSKYISPTSFEKVRSSIFQSSISNRNDSDNPSKRGSILFYSAKGKRKPVFLLEQCTSVVIDNDGKLLIHGLITVPLLYEEKEIECKLEGSEFPAVTFQNIGNIGTLRDPRPKPTFIQISTPEIQKWIIGILGAFSIDSSSPKNTEEVTALFKSPQWPPKLFLTLNEICGITMKSSNDTFNYLSNLLFEKIKFSESGQLSIWNEAVSKGVWERKVLERVETEMKIRQFYEWTAEMKNCLKNNGIVLSKPSDPLEILNQISEIVPGLKPALLSLLGEVSEEKASNAYVEKDEGQDTENGVDTSDSEGSLSYSGTSDGSLSDQESYADKNSASEQTTSNNEIDNESVAAYEHNSAVIFEENSLLYGHVTKRMSTYDGGLLINTIKVIFSFYYFLSRTMNNFRNKFCRTHCSIKKMMKRNN